MINIQILNYPESFHFIGEGQAIRGDRGWPAITQAIHGHQAIRGWPGSAVGPEQLCRISRDNAVSFSRDDADISRDEVVGMRKLLAQPR